jgi:predicted nucleic acid-binding protein
MKVAVFDSNVVVSAGINRRGAPGILIEMVLARQLHAVTCPSIIAEYGEVSRRSKFLPHNFPPYWLGNLISESLHLPEPAPWPYALPDPKDAPFLALAHGSGAWLVTGNLKHFPERARRGVTVISPAEYLVHLGASSHQR